MSRNDSLFSLASPVLGDEWPNRMMTSNFAQRILVVDPDPSLRELLRYLLACDGHEVEEAQTGTQALDKLEHVDFDVVLTGAAELEISGNAPFPRIEARGGSTPVLKMNCDSLRDPSEEIRRFMFNPFDLDSIRQALASLQELVGMADGQVAARHTPQLVAV